MMPLSGCLFLQAWKKATLEFVSVVKAQTTSTSSVQYNLILEAIDGGYKKRYEAVVYGTPNKELPPYKTDGGWMAWEEKRELVAFNLVEGWSEDGNDVGIVGKLTTDREIDLEVVNIAKFAVNEYNNKENATLEFVRVVKAQTMSTSSVQYSLILEAIDGSYKRRYEAVVYGTPNKELPPYKTEGGWMAWEEKKELVAFNVLVGEWTDDGNDVGIEDMAKSAEVVGGDPK